MADWSKHNSTFPELHRLYHSPRPSNVLGSTILAQTLLRDPALFAHKNSSQPSPTLSSSSMDTPENRIFQHILINQGLYNIIHGMSEVISATAVAPIERVYSLMQCQNEMLKYGHLSTPYKGMKDCFLRTIKHEGVLALWRGNSMNVITPLVLGTSIIGVTYLMATNGIHEPPLWFLPLIGMLVRHPLDYARTRLANDVKAAEEVHFSLNSSGKSFSNSVAKWKFNGVFDVYKKTLRLEGIIGLYRGWTPACFGFFAQRAILENQSKDKPPSIITPMAFMSLPIVFYPALTISHRMMMTCGEVTKYKGAMDAALKIVKHEGVSSLYKGLGPYMIYCSAKYAFVLAFFLLVASGIDKLEE